MRSDRLQYQPDSGLVRTTAFLTSSEPAHAVSATLFRRHEALQLLVPVLHDDERGRRGARVGPGRFDHQEVLPVERHIVRTATTGAVAV